MLCEETEVSYGVILPLVTGEDLMFAKALDDKEEDQTGGRSRQKQFLDVGSCLKVFPAKFI